MHQKVLSCSAQLLLEPLRSNDVGIAVHRAIMLCFIQFSELKAFRFTLPHSSKIPPIRHIYVGCSEVSVCGLYLTQAAIE